MVTKELTPAALLTVSDEDLYFTYMNLLRGKRIYRVRKIDEIIQYEAAERWLMYWTFKDNRRRLFELVMGINPKSAIA